MTTKNYLYRVTARKIGPAGEITEMPTREALCDRRDEAAVRASEMDAEPGRWFIQMRKLRGLTHGNPYVWTWDSVNNTFWVAAKFDATGGTAPMFPAADPPAPSKVAEAVRVEIDHNSIPRPEIQPKVWQAPIGENAPAICVEKSRIQKPAANKKAAAVSPKACNKT